MRIQPKPYPICQLLLGMFVLGAASSYSYVAHAAEQQQIPRGVPMKSWHENGRDGRYLLQVIQGRAPNAGKTVVGTVTSDTDCDADAEGLSHCHNTIDLAGGGKITVIDTHQMHSYRCLGAGDKISLTGVDRGWIMGALPGK